MTRKTFPSLEVNGFELRILKKEEAPLIVDFYKRNEEHLQKWDPEKPDGFYQLKYWEEKSELWQNEFIEDKSCRLIIFKKSKMIGSINFTSIERGPFQNSRLGYKICSEHEGQRVMSRCLRVALDYVFNELEIHRVEANCIPENFRSRKLLSRLGFVEHGVASEYLKINGRWQDHVLTSKVNPVWDKK